jgi:uncharacterized delta-60 repeat protein
MNAATIRTIACMLGLAACAATAAPRSLDPTFGSIGLAAAPFKAYGFAVHNGKILIGGTDASNRAKIARLDENGLLDTSFGDAGTAEVPLAYGPANVLAIARAPGATYAAGVTFPDYKQTAYLFVARFDDSGRPDSSFAGTGVITLPVLPPTGAEQFLPYVGLGVGSDGLPVVAAMASASGAGLMDAVLMRFRANGSVDFALRPELVSSLVAGPLVAADGTIYLAGGGIGAKSNLVMRFDAHGRPDPAFGGDGRVTLPYGPANAALAGGGRVLVAAYQAGTPAMRLMRLAPDGQLDATFGIHGIAEVALGECPLPVSSHIDPCPRYLPGLAVLPDGSVVQSGLQFHSQDSRSGLVIARFGVDGVPDPAFPFAAMPAWSHLDAGALALDALRGRLYVGWEIYFRSIARLIVAPSSTTVAIEGPTNPVVAGQVAAIRVNVEGEMADGYVALAEDASAIRGCEKIALVTAGPATATATCTVQLEPGVHQIVAAYYGNARNSAAISKAWIQVVGEPAGTRVMEFFDASTGDYFLTADAAEIATMREPWAPTGQSFHVFPNYLPGTAAHCRYLWQPASALGRAHFFGISNVECSLRDRWQFEGRVLFVMLPDEWGTCPGGTVPLYRLFNPGGAGAPLHRFTIDAAVRGEMLASGWIAEGLGVGVQACVTP